MPRYEFTDAQRKAVNDGAIRAYNVGRGLLEVADCQQEAWLWVLENLPTVIRWEEEDKGHGKLKSAAYHAGLHLVRDTMRQNGGSKPQDFANYAAATVQDLLPTVFLDQSFQTGQEVSDEIHHRQIPSEGGTGLAMVADVKAAFGKLTAEQKTILFMLHGEQGRSYDDIGEQIGCSGATVRRREQRALEAIVDSLGGERAKFRKRRKVDA